MFDPFEFMYIFLQRQHRIFHWSSSEFHYEISHSKQFHYTALLPEKIHTSRLKQRHTQYQLELLYVTKEGILPGKQELSSERRQIQS